MRSGRCRWAKDRYADQPPTAAGDKVGQFALHDLNLVQEDDRPVPTNQWWTDLLVNRFPESLWALPLMADTHERGLDVFFSTRWRPQRAWLAF